MSVTMAPANDRGAERSGARRRSAAVVHAGGQVIKAGNRLGEARRSA